jgi:hypothetical protein
LLLLISTAIAATESSSGRLLLLASKEFESLLGCAAAVIDEPIMVAIERSVARNCPS